MHALNSKCMHVLKCPLKCDEQMQYHGREPEAEQTCAAGASTANQLDERAPGGCLMCSLMHPGGPERDCDYSIDWGYAWWRRWRQSPRRWGR
jgi:hypothetical protein